MKQIYVRLLWTNMPSSCSMLQTPSELTYLVTNTAQRDLSKVAPIIRGQKESGTLMTMLYKEITKSWDPCN